MLAGTWLGGRAGHAHAGHAHVQEAAPADDPGSRAEAIAEALEADGPAGARMALRFLGSDPPAFFRDRVIEKLGEVMGEDPGFAEGEDLDSPANRRAVTRVKSHFEIE